MKTLIKYILPIVFLSACSDDCSEYDYQTNQRCIDIKFPKGKEIREYAKAGVSCKELCKQFKPCMDSNIIYVEEKTFCQLSFGSSKPMYNSTGLPMNSYVHISVPSDSISDVTRLFIISNGGF